jgi:Protein of unknown function (DUF3667)/Yip1 domain
MNCKNCDTELSQNYCPNCGQPAKLKRIDAHYMQHEIEHLLHFERGFLYTVKELVLRPGKTVREYLHDNRSRLVKPVVFIIVTSLIYTILASIFHVETSLMGFEEEKKSNITLIFKWLEKYYGYFNIIIGVFIAFWIKVFFRKYGYNFFEILVMWCFIMGLGMLIGALYVLLQATIKTDFGQMAGIVLLIYIIWAIGQTFDKNKKLNYLKALLAYLLGAITLFLFLILLGTFLNLFIKH